MTVLDLGLSPETCTWVNSTGASTAPGGAVLYGPTNNNVNNSYRAGARWATVAIPNGATITSAVLTWTQAPAFGAITSVNAVVHQVNNAPALAANQHTTAGDSIAGPTTPSASVGLTASIQKLVNRPMWVAGNAVTIRLWGTCQYVQAQVSGVALVIEYLDAKVGVHVGGSWKKAPVKMHNGTEWKTAKPKVYIGGQWVDTE